MFPFHDGGNGLERMKLADILRTKACMTKTWVGTSSSNEITTIAAIDRMLTIFVDRLIAPCFLQLMISGPKTS